MKLRMLFLSMVAFFMLALSGCTDSTLNPFSGLLDGACVSDSTGNCTSQANATDCDNWAATTGTFYAGVTCASLGY